jgi:hypothetical protein
VVWGTYLILPPWSHPFHSPYLLSPPLESPSSSLLSLSSYLHLHLSPLWLPSWVSQADQWTSARGCTSLNEAAQSCDVAAVPRSVRRWLEWVRSGVNQEVGWWYERWWWLHS